MAGGGEEKRRTRRSYRPSVEAMEALRLLSSAPAAAPWSSVAAEHNHLADSGLGTLPRVDGIPSVSKETWDTALLQTHLADIFTGLSSQPAAASASTTSAIDTAALSSGLTQLNKYLSRAWYRAAIPPQIHEDCSQAVFATLLQQMGRDRFDSLVIDVGHSGIKDVLSRETSEGVDFFRAVDMIKKRAQRERIYQSLDSMDVPAPAVNSKTHAWREALREAIDQSLSPREASLINDTLMGKTPAEIAQLWGVAPKTISNEKTRVLQKLRDVLLAQHVD